MHGDIVNGFNVAIQGIIKTNNYIPMHRLLCKCTL